jgi:transposase
MSSNLDKKHLARRTYGKIFILKIVKSIERGVSRRFITQKHGIARSVLAGWMRDFGSPDYHARKQGHLSQQEKRSIVRAIQEGRMTIFEARTAYRINSVATITTWIKESKRENAELGVSNTALMSRKKQDQHPDPDTKKALAEALKKLEEAELKVQALNTLIDVAEEQFKIAIRKKAGAKQSSE